MPSGRPLFNNIISLVVVNVVVVVLLLQMKTCTYIVHVYVHIQYCT